MDVLNNTDIKIMTPGPTQVADNVYRARSLRTTNPDLDPAFYDFYRDTCHLFGKLIHTKNACFILGGEGILGLEAACASLTEPGDRVLVNACAQRYAERFVKSGGSIVSDPEGIWHFNCG